MSILGVGIVASSLSLAVVVSGMSAGSLPGFNVTKRSARLARLATPKRKAGVDRTLAEALY